MVFDPKKMPQKMGVNHPFFQDPFLCSTVIGNWVLSGQHCDQRDWRVGSFGDSAVVWWVCTLHAFLKTAGFDKTTVQVWKCIRNFRKGVVFYLMISNESNDLQARPIWLWILYETIDFQKWNLLREHACHIRWNSYFKMPEWEVERQDPLPPSWIRLQPGCVSLWI